MMIFSSFIEILLAAIIIFVLGFFITKTFHYRRLWLQCKNKVSWIMPSKDPNNWVVQKSFSYHSGVFPTYAVVDKDTKVHVANDFKTEQAAREYIYHNRDQFQQDE